MKSAILALILLSVTCRKMDTDYPPVFPATYEDMFGILKLNVEQEYKYDEVINEEKTGRSGTITFSLKDTSLTEVYRGQITRAPFGFYYMTKDSCKLSSKGYMNFPLEQSVFINNAGWDMALINDTARLKFDSNGGTYRYRILIYK